LCDASVYPHRGVFESACARLHRLCVRAARAGRTTPAVMKASAARHACLPRQHIRQSLQMLIRPAWPPSGFANAHRSVRPARGGGGGALTLSGINSRPRDPDFHGASRSCR